MGEDEPRGNPAGLRQRELCLADAARGAELSAEAGWNQAPADWEYMLRHGRGLGVETVDGNLVGTAVILPYGRRLAWISMVLVSRAWRRRGIATRLMHACVADLAERGVTPALDATEAGRQVYAPMGFRPGPSLTRWERPPGKALPTGPIGRETKTPSMDTLDADRAAAVADWDEEVFGADRSSVLRHLAKRRRGLILRSGEGTGKIRGYLLSRDGRCAVQLGPLCAAAESDAEVLLDAALAEIDDPVYLDAPDSESWSDFLRARGFSPQRPFIRMYGPGPEPVADWSRIFAIGGPELG